MKKMLNFEDYFFESIFENKSEITVILSDRLYELLLAIEHPVSEDLLSINEDQFKSSKVAYIDYDDEKHGNFTYIIPIKIKDAIKIRRPDAKDDQINTIYTFNIENTKRLGSEQYFPEVWDNFRNSTSINKVVNKLFPNKHKPSGEPGKDLESFKNLFITERKKVKNVFDSFKIVSGKDINKYYLEENHDGDARNSILSKSCMIHKSCNDYIDFYSENEGVDMVIMLSDTEEDKIIGRALLWDIEYINNEKVERKFMDRIYTIHDSDINLFIDFAKKNKWLYKQEQDSNNNTSIVDPLTGESNNVKLKTKSSFDEKSYYPYLDTLKYFYHNDRYLSNSHNYGNDYYYLQDTSGGFEDNENPDDGDDNAIYISFYGRSFYHDELVYCEFGDDYRLPRDAIYLSNFEVYATNNYVENHLEWSEPLQYYIYKDEAVESDYYNGEYISISESYLAFKVGAASEEFDEIYNNDAYSEYVLERDIQIRDFIKYYFEEHMYFNPDDKNYFVKCKTLKSKGEKEVYAHKVWDKPDIFKWKGSYWLDDVGDPKKFDELVGQLRIFDNKNNKI